MISRAFFYLAPPALAAFLAPFSPAAGQEKPEAPAADERDWLESYYEKPSPEKFVEKVKEFSQDGTLAEERARPALIGFFSQVIRQNRDKIAEWHKALSGLPAEERQILNSAMLYARVSEADAILKQEVGEEQLKKEQEAASKILEMKLAEVQTVDMLWGYFYATGSEQAIRRIINCFIYEDAPDSPNFAKIPEGFRPLYRELPQAATWSLASNAARHPKVLAILEDLLAKKDELSPTERRLLNDTVLSEIKPEKYRRTEPPK